MTDILLAHSYHLPYDPKQVRKMQPYPPLGTLYAATALREHGISVAVFDSMLQDPISAFPEILEQQRPRILAIYEDDFNFLSKMCLTRTMPRRISAMGPTSYWLVRLSRVWSICAHRSCTAANCFTIFPESYTSRLEAIFFRAR